MNPARFMFIAGEPSGDENAAQLVRSLRKQLATQDVFEPRFFGAGGQRMREAGVETFVDMTAHSVIGFSDVFKKILTFRRIFNQLCALAEARQPNAIVCVDFSGFNRRLGHAIVRRVRARRLDWFRNWSPKLIQYVSPQVWASRPGRALLMREDFDLVLSIFPFEREWYARHAPGLRVEFVGHPMLDRYSAMLPKADQSRPLGESRLLLLPGSRKAELKRHLPAMSGALEIIRSEFPDIAATLILPNQGLVEIAKRIGIPTGAQVSIGGLHQELVRSDLALASTGTVTMECALFGVPTIAFYRTSWSTYQIGRRIVTVRYLAMPNILADEEVFPEFVQDEATSKNIGRTAIELLKDRPRRAGIAGKLRRVVVSLGGPGASERAAQAILRVVKQS